MINLHNYNLNTIKFNLYKKLNYSNIHKVPKLIKIVINTGLGLKAQNKIYLNKVINEMRLIFGQHPIITLTKKSIANFKIRKDVPIGLKITLRKKLMYAFFEKLIKLVFPTIKDFNGLMKKHFDSYGNYNISIKNQLLFPEVNFEDIDTERGYNISIITTAQTQVEGFFLLKEFGFPFEYNDY